MGPLPKIKGSMGLFSKGHGDSREEIPVSQRHITGQIGGLYLDVSATRINPASSCHWRYPGNHPDFDRVEQMDGQPPQP